jgi:predicted phage terminase large subunit-like protein
MNFNEILKARAVIASVLSQVKDISSPAKRESIYEMVQDEREELARNDFHTYVTIMAKEVMPDDFIDGVHLYLYCQELMEIEKAIVKGRKLKTKKFKRKLQIWVPPGAMKSLILNLFVTWCMGRHPMWRFIHVGNTTDFAQANFGIRIKSVLVSEQYRSIFPEYNIDPKVDTRGYWRSTKAGEYFCCGAGVPIAGRRAELTICDDVISEQTAFSKGERGKINKWYVPGLRSRLLPGGCEVIVNTRWHVDDLSGYITEVDRKAGDPWRIIAIPARLSASMADFLNEVAKKNKIGWSQITEGGSFWPELWDEATLDEVEATQPEPHLWPALYMQDPINAGGSIFSEDLFKSYVAAEPPKCSMTIVSLDTAFSVADRADYTAVTVWGIFEEDMPMPGGTTMTIPRVIKIHNEKGRYEFPDLVDLCHDLRTDWKPEIFLIEKKASGQSLIQELRRLGFPVEEYLPEKDKRARALACQPYFKSGMIYFFENEDESDVELNKEFTDELLRFSPGAGGKDDYVDSMTQAILFLVDSTLIENPNNADPFDDDEDSDTMKTRKTYWGRRR